MITAVDPSTGELIRAYPEHTAAQIAARVDGAHAAWLRWREQPFERRARPLLRAAELLRARASELALLMAHEMGKPVAQGRNEVEKCAWVCAHCAQHAQSWLADEPVATEARDSAVVYRPLGPVLAVMPWNFPLWQVFRFAAPALMAGNAAVLKHAANVPGCALAIEALLRDAGLPEGLFSTLLIPSDAVAAVIAHDAIRAVTVTGSDRAGAAVAAKAGASIKKTVLELGGSDPYLVLEDADVEAAAEACVQSRLINAGQSCIAAKRFIVVTAVLQEFTARFVARMAAARVGDPRDEATEVGPLARVDLRDALHAQVRASVEAGATALLGGTVPDRPGAWYPPTVLADVQPGMTAFDDELFGPVAALVAAADEDAAIELANRNRYGLGAAVFTRDLARGRRIAADRLDAGACFVNAFVRSDPRLPFGGVKRSGYGRELGRAGILEFVNVKTVWVAEEKG